MLAFVRGGRRPPTVWPFTVVAAVTLLAWLAVAVTPATAALPGTNGRIAFGAFNGTGWHIFTVRPDGSGLTEILDDAFDPAWSPDGRHLAYDAGAPTDQGIIVSDTSGNHAVQITHAPSPSFEKAPAWSRDGSRLALIRCKAVGQCALVVIDANGSNPHRLTAWGDLWSDQPSWSADDSTLIFEQDDAIYSIHSDGTGLTQLTFPGSKMDFSPDYSPDGSQILWSRSDMFGGAGDLWVMNADGSGQTQITTSATDETFPSWSPDGRKLTFACRHQGSYLPCTSWADGSHERVLSGPPIALGDAPPGPDWQPLS